MGTGTSAGREILVPVWSDAEAHYTGLLMCTGEALFDYTGGDDFAPRVHRGVLYLIPRNSHALDCRRR